MVGFTALTQSDEAQSLAVLERHNRFLRPIFTKYRGREVKTMGDSFLVEFESALDATTCAVEIQRFLHDYNISSRDDWKITLRIGIHLGDVVRSGDDIIGDAVNIASRIQPLADPEGVCISEQVYDQVRNKMMPQAMVKLGAQDLKGVKFAVDVYRVVLPWEKGETVDMAPDEHRVAVLPFVNMSPDPNDEFFADGLTEELIDRLCQVRGLEVIARTSVMSYKKKDVKVATIGRELRVGALVEGSVRKAGNRIRVTAQLVNANTEGHLWSSRYDRDLDDIFAVQTDIAEQVASALQVHLQGSEEEAIKQKRTENIEAYTLYLRGRQLWNRRSKEALGEALKCFQRAREIDPSFALAYSGIADCYGSMESWGHATSEEVAPKMKENLLKALTLDNNLAEAHATYASMLALYEWRWEEAELEFKRAIEINPSYASAHQWYAYCMLRFGKRWEEEMREVERALELDPLAPVMSLNKGQSLFLRERYDEAIEWFGKVAEMDPSFTRAYLFQSGCYLASGRYEKAIELAEKYIHLAGLSEGQAKMNMAFMYAFSGRKADARKLLSEILAASDKSIPVSDFASTYFGLGEVDKTFEYLEAALAKREPNLPFALSDPFLRPLRTDPRFQELRRKVGIE